MSRTSAAAEFFRGLPARLLPVVHSGCNVLSRLISVLPRVRLLLRSCPGCARLPPPVRCWCKSLAFNTNLDSTPAPAVVLSWQSIQAETPEAEGRKHTRLGKGFQFYNDLEQQVARASLCALL